jgi:hypothetical protein
LISDDYQEILTGRRGNLQAESIPSDLSHTDEEALMKRTDDRLFLHEEILLLVLRDEKGTFFNTKSYKPALGAALMAELLLDKRVEIEEGRKKLVRLVDSGTMDDPVLDEALGKIRNAKRRASLKNWVTRFSNLPKLQHKIAAGLCRKRILREDEGQVLFLFRQKIYPEVDSRPERRLIDRLRRAIVGESRELEPRTVILLSLAKSADLLSIPFERRLLRERKKRIKQIVEGELLGKAAKEAIDAAHAAVFVAGIIPAVSSS